MPVYWSEWSKEIRVLTSLTDPFCFQVINIFTLVFVFLPSKVGLQVSIDLQITTTPRNNHNSINYLFIWIVFQRKPASCRPKSGAIQNSSILSHILLINCIWRSRFTRKPPFLPIERKSFIPSAILNCLYLGPLGCKYAKVGLACITGDQACFFVLFCFVFQGKGRGRERRGKNTPDTFILRAASHPRYK